MRYFASISGVIGFDEAKKIERDYSIKSVVYVVSCALSMVWGSSKLVSVHRA